MANKFIDLTGKRFGRWLVIGRTPREKGKQGCSQWHCHCDCGNTKDRVEYSGLVSGSSQSCGCLRRELLVKADKTHHQSNPVYSIWMCMKTRCYNLKHPSAKDYGRRGIKVCPRWLASFDDFASDMGPRPSKDHQIERKDNDGNYTPENCVWETRQAQMSNRRSNIRCHWNGENMTLTQVARLENVDYIRLHNRFRSNGTPLEEAVEELKAAGHQFYERNTGVNKTSRTRKRQSRLKHLIPNYVPFVDPLSDIW